MVMSGALGLRQGMAEAPVPYARLLASTEKGRALLREMSEKSAVPVITKPASARELDTPARGVFELTADARDLYVLGYEAAAERTAGSDWRTSPVIL